MALSTGDNHPRRTAATTPRLLTHPADDPARAEVETFIQQVFADHYGAEVRRFAPTLVSLRDADDAIIAAAGYRDAGTAPLFLERYLNAPVESLLHGVSGGDVPRGGIVEVGHLAASRAGEGRRLILMLGPHLAAQRFSWVVGTLTTELRHLFLRIGVAPLALGTANPQALGEEAREWGSYYDHHPVVLAGSLDSALQQLARRLARLTDGQ